MQNFFKGLIQKHSRTVGEKTEVDGIVTLALLWLRVFGQQVLDPEWTWGKYYIHQLMNLSLFVYVFFGTLDILKSTKDPEVVAEACYTIIMIFVFPLKMFLFLSNRLVFRDLYMTAKTTLMDTIRQESNDKVTEVLTTAKRAIYFLYAIVVIPASIYEATTLWNYMNGRLTLLSRSTSTLVPMATPYYEAAWFLHTIFLLQLSSTIILDMWFVLLIYFLCVASKSLVKKLHVEPRRKDEGSLSFSKRLSGVLREFHAAHVQQDEYLKHLRKMYKWLSFVPLCNAAMCTCLILLLMSKDVNWRFAPHMLPMFAEIFVYNWFGEQIKTKTTEFYLALLYFDWTHLQMHEKKSYQILLTYTQQEFGIKTAVGYQLSLITMTTVLKVSYQAFTVLKTIEG